MESRTVPASMEHLDEVMAFLDELLQREGCPEGELRLAAISAEELFTNIASYAYGEEGGTVRVECGVRPAEPAQGAAAEPEKELEIRFTDRGIPYDPFSREDPDLTAPIEERPIGGLGIYMVKQFMDGTEYFREDGCNITVIRKRFPAG